MWACAGSRPVLAPARCDSLLAVGSQRGAVVLRPLGCCVFAGPLRLPRRKRAPRKAAPSSCRLLRLARASPCGFQSICMLCSQTYSRLFRRRGSEPPAWCCTARSAERNAGRPADPHDRGRWAVRRKEVWEAGASSALRTDSNITGGERLLIYPRGTRPGSDSKGNATDAAADELWRGRILLEEDHFAAVLKPQGTPMCAATPLPRPPARATPLPRQAPFLPPNAPPPPSPQPQPPPPPPPWRRCRRHRGRAGGGGQVLSHRRGGAQAPAAGASRSRARAAAGARPARPAPPRPAPPRPAGAAGAAHSAPRAADPPPPPPPLRTNRTHRVPHPVLIGHAARRRSSRLRWKGLRSQRPQVGGARRVRLVRGEGRGVPD